VGSNLNQKTLPSIDTFEQRQMTIQAKVVRLCKLYPELTQSYRKLIFAYWSHYNKSLVSVDMTGFMMIPIVNVEQLEDPLSISRAFRKANERGLIKVPELTQLERLEREKEFRAIYGRP
jgi:hypothetical protein